MDPSRAVQNPDDVGRNGTSKLDLSEVLRIGGREEMFGGSPRIWNRYYSTVSGILDTVAGVDEGVRE